MSIFFSIIQCFFTGPNTSPTNVWGHSKSSTSIIAQWGNVPPADQNGVILSYTITYKALPDGSPRHTVVSASTTQVTLTGLNEYTNYSIRVFASTVKGAGRISAPIFVITDEGSKFSTAPLVYINGQIMLYSRVHRGYLSTPIFRHA